MIATACQRSAAATPTFQTSKLRIDAPTPTPVTRPASFDAAATSVVPISAPATVSTAGPATTVQELAVTSTRQPDTTGPQASTPIAIVLPADPEAYVPGVRSSHGSVTGPISTEGQSAGPFHSIAWGRKVTPEFRVKTIAICDRLEIDPDYLMAVMAFDTGRTFDPAVINASSGAVGLIQFLPATIHELGSTPEQLRAMSAMEQLDMMEAYLYRFRGRLTSLEDVFMAVLYPSAIGQKSDFILFGNLDVLYAQNRGLDLNSDGAITKAEASEKVRDSLAEGLATENRG